MPNPLKMDPSAFDVFFADTLAFFAKRPDGEHRGTIKACIFDEGCSDVFDDSTGTASKIGTLNFQIRAVDWAASISTPPQAGDRFQSPFTNRFYAAVTALPHNGDAWYIEAREVRPL